MVYWKIFSTWKTLILKIFFASMFDYHYLSVFFLACRWQIVLLNFYIWSSIQLNHWAECFFKNTYNEFSSFFSSSLLQLLMAIDDTLAIRKILKWHSSFSKLTKPQFSRILRSTKLLIFTQNHQWQGQVQGHAGRETRVRRRLIHSRPKVGNLWHFSEKRQAVLQTSWLQLTRN